MSQPSNPQDPFEMFRRLWGPLGVPLPGMTMPTLDPNEIEKRIQELRSVEAWLTMNLNVLRLGVQGLEVQKAALLALSAGTEGAKPAAPAEAPQPPNPMLWPWAAMQQAMMAGAQQPQQQHQQPSPAGEKRPK
jgi:hypothetical protein